MFQSVKVSLFDITKLQKEKWGTFNFGKTNGITLLMITNSRYVVVTNILQNLASDSSTISMYEYQLYVKDILRTLDIEFENIILPFVIKLLCQCNKGHSKVLRASNYQ